jgi:drug/metabolite transporter (DMT)-like permease
LSDSNSDLATDLGLVILAAIWGVNFTVLKVVLREIDPLALNALRFPLAGLALWLAVRASGGPRAPAREDIVRVIVLAVLGNVAYQLCFIIGIDWTFAGNASVRLATTPVWTVILSSLAGHERPTTWVIFGIVATLVGMILVVVGGKEPLSLGSDTVRGDLLMIAGAILWSVYTVGGKGPVSRYGPLRVTAWTLWIATPVLVLFGLPSLLATDLPAIRAATWVGVVYSGVFSIGVAYLLWYRGVHRIGNNRTAVYSNLVPVWALATAWIWIGETPTVLQGAGAGVILAGLTVARLAQSPGPSSFRWISSGNS